MLGLYKINLIFLVTVLRTIFFLRIFNRSVILIVVTLNIHLSYPHHTYF